MHDKFILFYAQTLVDREYADPLMLAVSCASTNLDKLVSDR